MTDTRSLALAQAAHDLRVTATRYAHDSEDDRKVAADALAALKAAALRYAQALAAAASGDD